MDVQTQIIIVMTTYLTLLLTFFVAGFVAVISTLFIPPGKKS